MKVVITGESIKIGQLLKKLNLIPSGGSAKEYLVHNDVKIGSTKVEMRGTKVSIDNIVWINDELYQIVRQGS